MDQFKRLIRHQAVSPGIALKHKNSVPNIMPSSSNTQDRPEYGYNNRGRGTRQTRPGNESAGQGSWGQPPPVPMEVDSLHYSGSGMGSVPPVVYSHHGIQGTVTSPLSPMGVAPYHQLEVSQPQISHTSSAPPLAASNSRDHSTSQIYAQSNRGAVPLGPYGSNSSSAHNPPLTPATPMKQPWPDVGGYRPTGGNAPPPYVPTESQPSFNARHTGGASKGHVSSQFHASGSTSSSTSQTRHNLPRCKLPQCEKLAIFDDHIKEQREYCEEHIKRAISVGFAGCCVICETMPARLDSELRVCSEACKKRLEATSTRSNSGAAYYRQPTGQSAVPPQSGQPTPQPPLHSHGAVASVQPAPAAKFCENCHSSQAALGKKHCNACAAALAADPRGTKKRRPGKDDLSHSVPDGLRPACQDCRRPIKESRAGRYCSKECEEASRKYSSASRSK